MILSCYSMVSKIGAAFKVTFLHESTIHELLRYIVFKSLQLFVVWAYLQQM